MAGGCRPAHGFNFLDRELKGQQRLIGAAAGVLEVDADRACFNHFLRGARHVFGGRAVAPFDIGGDRNLHGADDARDSSHHFLARDVLAVGISERVGDSGGGGGDGGETGIFKDAGAGDIPGVGENEDASAMELAEVDGFFELSGHGI